MIELEKNEVKNILKVKYNTVAKLYLQMIRSVLNVVFIMLIF